MINICLCFSVNTDGNKEIFKEAKLLVMSNVNPLKILVGPLRNHPPLKKN